MNLLYSILSIRTVIIVPVNMHKSVTLSKQCGLTKTWKINFVYQKIYVFDGELFRRCGQNLCPSTGMRMTRVQYAHRPRTVRTVGKVHHQKRKFSGRQDWFFKFLYQTQMITYVITFFHNYLSFVFPSNLAKSISAQIDTFLAFTPKSIISLNDSETNHTFITIILRPFRWCISK